MPSEEILHRISSSDFASALGNVLGDTAANACDGRGKMRPITFVCRETLALTPDEMVQQILDLSKWPDFQGYGPIPGIKTAEFEVRTVSVVGTRIRVTNRDGSTHVEEIVEWQPDLLLRLHMHEFSPPLSRLATGMFETWQFQRVDQETRVIRSFEIHAKSIAARAILWGISFLLKQAIVRHLRQLKQSAGQNDMA